MVNQVIAIFILPLFIKNLGAELYGIWIISGIILGYLGIMDLGFGQGVMKYISEAYVKNDIFKLNKVYNTASLLFLLLGFIILIIIYCFHIQIVQLFAINFENIKTANQLLLVSAVFAPFLWLSKITGITFRGILRFKEYSLFSSLQELGKTLAMLFLIIKGFDILNIAIITNVVYLALWIPSLFVLFRIFPDLAFKKKFISFDVIKEMMPFSMGVFYSQLIAMLALQADNLIIGIAVSMSGVTAYIVASKLFYISSNYMSMLSGVLQPTTYQAFANNDKGLIDKILTKGTKYLAMLYTPIGYLGIIISPLFINTWMGPEYLKYVVWSQVFMAVFVFTSGTGIPLNLVFNSGRTRQVNIFKTATIFVNLIISILLVKKLGIGGPIIGTLIAGLLSPLMFPYFCKLINADWKKLMVVILKIKLFNLPFAFFFYWLSFKIYPNWLNLILFSVVIVIVFYVNSYLVFCDEDEKKDILIFLDIFKFKNIRRKILNIM